MYATPQRKGSGGGQSGDCTGESGRLDSRWDAERACRIVAKIGKAVGAVAASVEKRRRDNATGMLVPVTLKKSVSAHDLRWSFGTRWADRLMPAILQRLAKIAATMRYYVAMDADAAGDEFWGAGLGK
jgi:hypothetical protein